MAGIKSSGRYAPRSKNNIQAKSSQAVAGQIAAQQLASGPRATSASYNPASAEASQELMASTTGNFANTNPQAPQSGS